MINVTFTAQKLNFSIKDFFSKCDQIRIFFTFTEEILNGKLLFLCSALRIHKCFISVSRSKSFEKALMKAIWELLQLICLFLRVLLFLCSIFVIGRCFIINDNKWNSLFSDQGSLRFEVKLKFEVDLH